MYVALRRAPRPDSANTHIVQISLVPPNYLRTTESSRFRWARGAPLPSRFRLYPPAISAPQHRPDSTGRVAHPYRPDSAGTPQLSPHHKIIQIPLRCVAHSYRPDTATTPDLLPHHNIVQIQLVGVAHPYRADSARTSPQFPYEPRKYFGGGTKYCCQTSSLYIQTTPQFQTLNSCLDRMLSVGGPPG